MTTLPYTTILMPPQPQQWMLKSFALRNPGLRFAECSLLLDSEYALSVTEVDEVEFIISKLAVCARSGTVVDLDYWIEPGCALVLNSDVPMDGWSSTVENNPDRTGIFLASVDLQISLLSVT